MQTVERVWEIADPGEAEVASLSNALNCHPLLARVLLNRGIEDPETARRFLEPSLDALYPHHDLPDVSTAGDRLERAVAEGETMTIYGDRDVDGVTGAALLLRLLQDHGATVGYRFPEKYDGHGVHASHIHELADRGTELLVTVDCGTDSERTLDHARDAGMDAIVLDHHPHEGDLPPAVGFVNPTREDSDYPNDALSGAGVAFKTGRAIVDRLDADLAEYHAYALPLAGLATVADRARLGLENRALVCLGYERLDACPLVGLRAIADHCEVTSVRDLGWSLAPLLNAAKEDRSGDLMLRALFARDEDRIATLVDRLEEYRAQRKTERRERLAAFEACVTDQATEADDVLVVETPEYPGSAPETIARRSGKPVIAYRPKNGGYRGVARADLDIDLRALFEACGDLLEEYWGHPGAPGFFVASEQVDTLVASVQRELFDRYSDDELRPRLDIDATLLPEEVSADVVAAIEQLRPFGTGYEEPKIKLEEVDICRRDTFGADDRHVAFEPAQGTYRLLHWDGADRMEPWEGPGRYDVVGTIAWDDFGDCPAVSIIDFASVER